MKRSLFAVLLFVMGGLGFAQDLPVTYNVAPSIKAAEPFTDQSLKIVAVMVEFQVDDASTTVGDGTFASIYEGEYDNTILDPLPHGRDYFAAHLTFAKNYFNKVSNGQLAIEFEVLPNVVTLSGTMLDYSPPINSTDFERMTNLVEESWTLAAQQNSGYDLSSADLFVIYHAGVGRSVQLPGSLGNERDLPAIYLGLEAMREYRGESFSGFTVDDAVIENSIILPQTENREVESFGDTFLFEITTNGLLVSSIASYLGLPDLFNTETGVSAIGRFGLMDGQSIFAYNGTIPPEPSAWEKIFLGWAEPVVIQPYGDIDVSLTAEIAAQANDTTIIKVPINDTEYYLVENRRRDVNGDGAIVTINNGGSIYTMQMDRDTTGFFSFATDTLEGVIIDVDEFDWAMPGSGIVIWHIDEKIISEKIAQNAVNADIDNRGVDVEEADGIQDIGVEFRNIFGDIVTGEGTQDDMWFASNESELYENRFTPYSRPTTSSNSSAKSLISFTGFSDTTNTMRFSLSFGDSVVTPFYAEQLPTFSVNNELSYLGIGPLNYFYHLSGTKLQVQQYPGTLEMTMDDFSVYPPAVFFSSFNNTRNAVGVMDDNMNVYITNGSRQQRVQFNFRGDNITAPPVVMETGEGEYIVALGFASGDVIWYGGGTLPDNTAFPGGLFNGVLNVPVTRIFSDDENLYWLQSASEGVYYIGGNSSSVYEGTGNPVDALLTIDRIGRTVIILLLEGNRVEVVSNGELIAKMELEAAGPVERIAAADLKNNGENFILYTDGNLLRAVNKARASAENFPVRISSSIFTGDIAVADFEGDAKDEVIAVADDGSIYAFDGGTGNLVPGFPLTTGSQAGGAPAVFIEGGRISMAAFSSQGYLQAWNIGVTEGSQAFSGLYGNSRNSGYVPEALGEPAFEGDFLPADKAYNYPNPVYGSETHIRYHVTESSDVTIKIFDLAGEFVEELTDKASAGVDNETVWDVTNIQSGVYIARIEAEGINGASGFALVKIAVVK